MQETEINVDKLDFINLTFCCQEATVVQDFGDLTAIGRTYFINLHGGITEFELKAMNFCKIARSFLLNEEGKIIPSGVVYDNGMKLKNYCDGLYFPDYRYNGDTLLTGAVMGDCLPKDTMDIAWLYLPMEECQISCAFQ